MVERKRIATGEIGDDERVFVVLSGAANVRVREDVKHDRARRRDRIRQRRMVVDRQTCSGGVAADGRSGQRYRKGHEYIGLGKTKGNQRSPYAATAPPGFATTGNYVVLHHIAAVRRDSRRCTLIAGRTRLA